MNSSVNGIADKDCEGGMGGRGGGMDILSMLMPIVSPYFAAFLEKFLSGIFTRDRNRNT